MCMCVPLCGFCAHDAHGGQKGGSDPQKLQLYAVVTGLLWMLGTELGFLADAVNAPDTEPSR